MIDGLFATYGQNIGIKPAKTHMIDGLFAIFVLLSCWRIDVCLSLVEKKN